MIKAKTSLKALSVLRRPVKPPEPVFQEDELEMVRK